MKVTVRFLDTKMIGLTERLRTITASLSFTLNIKLIVVSSLWRTATECILGPPALEGKGSIKSPMIRTYVHTYVCL